jgi:hypothetical protein
MHACGICAHRRTTSRIQCRSKSKMTTDTKSHGAERGIREIALHIVADFEMIEHSPGGGVEMRHGRGMSQIIAVHATRIVIRDDQPGRACSIINLRCRHHEAMPGQPVCRSNNRPGQLKYLRIQNDPGMFGARLRRLRGRDVGPTGETVDGELNVCRCDLHGFRLPQSGSELNLFSWVFRSGLQLRGLALGGNE